MAVNGDVVPKANEGFAGVTAMETRTAAATLITAVPVIVPDVALIVDAPTPVPVARPPAVTVATEVSDELQVTVFVRTCVLPSL